PEQDRGRDGRGVGDDLLRRLRRQPDLPAAGGQAGGPQQGGNGAARADDPRAGGPGRGGSTADDGGQAQGLPGAQGATGDRRAGRLEAASWEGGAMSSSEGGHGGGWIVTYSDMITLLMACFIMIITFSTKEKEGYSRKRDSLIGGGGGTGLAGPSGQGRDRDAVVWLMHPLLARLAETGSELP